MRREKREGIISSLFILLFIFIVITTGWSLLHIPIKYNVTYKTIDTDPTLHSQIYEVMILDGVPRDKVERSLQLCPNVFGYTIVEEDISRYWYVGWEGFEGTPFPNDDNDYLILIADSDKYPNCNAGGFTLPPSGRVTVLYRDWWSDITLAHVIEHECAHNTEMYVNKLDNMDMNAVDFNVWLAYSGYGVYPVYYDNWDAVFSEFVINEYLMKSSP